MSSSRMNLQVNRLRRVANAMNSASRRTNISNAQRAMYSNTARRLRDTIAQIIATFVQRRARSRSGRSHARVAALSKVLHRSGNQK